MTRPMHFGLTLPQIKRSWAEARNDAVEFGELGFDSVWVCDHLYGVPMPNLPIFEAWSELEMRELDPRKLDAIGKQLGIPRLEKYAAEAGARLAAAGGAAGTIGAVAVAEIEAPAGDPGQLGLGFDVPVVPPKVFAPGELPPAY